MDTIAADPVAAQPGLGACWMGETRDGNSGYFGEFERGFVIHLWMDPAACGSCDGRIELRTVEFQVAPVLNPWPAPFDFPATISVIPFAPLMVVSATPCTTCRQYQTAPSSPGQPVRNLTDACDIPGHAPYAARGRADCVWVTPTRSASWGQLKVFHR